MKKQPLETDLAGVLREATDFIEIFEALPLRHQARDQSIVLVAPTEDMEAPTGTAAAALLGSFHATFPDPPLKMLDQFISQLAREGAPTQALAEVRSALQTVDDFQERYRQGAWADRTLGWFFEAVCAYAARAHHALDEADAAFKRWNAARIVQSAEIVIKDGEDRLVDMAFVANLLGIQQDSAATWVRRRGLVVHRIGRRKFVSLDALLEATREEPVAAGE